MEPAKGHSIYLWRMQCHRDTGPSSLYSACFNQKEFVIMKNDCNYMIMS